MQDQSTQALSFLQGGGELGELIRATDWSATPLGPPDTWPQSLKTTLGILLNSRYPMFVFWGPRLVKIYNDGYRPITGHKHPWALGRPGQEVWPEIWGDIKPLVDRALAGDPTWSDDLMLFMERHGFPEEVYFTFSYSPIRDESGGIGGMFCACTETTGEVLKERRLRTLRDLAAAPADARTVADACTLSAEVLDANHADVPFALIYLADGDGAVRLVAQSGVRPGDVAAPLVMTASDAEPAFPVYRVAETRLPERVTALEERFTRVPPGPWPEPPSTAMVLPLIDRGLERGVGAVVLGISSRRLFDDQYREWLELVSGQIGASISNARAAEEERKRAEALAEINRAKTAFFSNISHEFRTPLTLMLGPTEDALASPERALQGDALKTVYRNELRLLKLVNALLDFSRIEAGRMHASYEPTDLAELTADVASSFRSAVERAGLTFTVTCQPPDEPVYVDRDMWEKILLNLLSNALKFTFEGSVEVTLAAEAGRVVLAVRDTGIGIAEADIPRLFERFHRVEGARSRTHEGSGIGLALVNDLVRLHGGATSIESTPGGGTTVRVTLPTGCNHLPAQRIAPRRPLARQQGPNAFVLEALRWLPDGAGSPELTGLAGPGAETGMPGQELTPGYVLVADDNADMRDYLTRLLCPYWRVEAVPDGDAALAAARTRPPDLILSDVMMPGLDGFELLAALRADERTAAVPVVMLSARAGEEARIEGLQSGADDYIIKPFSARELVARANAQITLARNARERVELLARARQAKQEAELQKQHLYSLFMQAPVAIVVLKGPDHVVQLANPVACQLWGRPLEAVIDRPLFEALPEVRDQVWKTLLDRVLSSGLPESGSETPALVDRRGDGTLETVFFNFVHAPLRNVRGEVDGVMVIATDATEQVRSRRELDGLRQAAEAANRAKDEFLAMLGHELRNPLAPILTALQLLKLRGVDAAERERAIIERQVRHLVALVDDLLDVSRITGGKIELRKQPVEAAAVIASAIEMASPLFEQQRHRLTVDVPRTGLLLDADAGRLAQVVSNLLTNAAKYTEPGGSILLTAREEGEEVVVQVRDSGIGIAPDILPRIFDLFVQERQTLARWAGGLGLGLAIVRSLVALHGGTVTASSPGIGQGSEFTIRLPRASAAASAAAPREEASDEAFAMDRRRVLVVDDNADAAVLLADMLTAMGCAAHFVHDGPAALKAAELFRPEIAVLDIGLPVMDGYELARRFRASPQLRGIRLIALTAYGQEEDRRQSRTAGFVAHLVKPVDIDQLRSVLETSGTTPETTGVASA